MPVSPVNDEEPLALGRSGVAAPGTRLSPGERKV